MSRSWTHDFRARRQSGIPQQPEWNVLFRAAMMLELISEVSGRKFHIAPKALGKLLHLARLEGWQPERVSNDWPSDSWETEIILPHLGPYMPGRVSRGDADGLRRALTRALATGTVAADGTVQVAAETLLQITRQGAFRVVVSAVESLEPAFDGTAA
jgi:hypothetical protein